MKTFKKVIRIFVLIFLIVLATSGMLATFLPTTRERYMDKEITTEQVDKKKEDNIEDEERRN